MVEPSPPTDPVSCFKAENAFTRVVILTTNACCAVQASTDPITVTEDVPRQLSDRHDGHEADQRWGQTNLLGEGEEQDHPILGTGEIAPRIGPYRNDEIKYLCIYTLFTGVQNERSFFFAISN